MFKERILPVSIIFLGISIIISASIIGNAMKVKGQYVSGGLGSISQGIINGSGNIVNNRNNQANLNSTLDLSEAASYLGISPDILMDVVKNKDSKIPYVKIGVDYIFSKDALDKWLETVRFEMN